MIEISNLTKVYGQQAAIDDISFKVDTGEIVGFLGPNGAGKTTTMKIITCFMPPTSGRVTVGGLDVEQHSMDVRRMIGYLPELNPLYSDMNVVDFLRYIAELRELEEGRINLRIREMVDICGLGDVLHKDISQLSKGYRQRVGLAQAMIHDPKILILDEPTIGLDPNQVVDIRNLIKKLGRAKTVILSTHILSEVQATCDRAVIINRGKIVADSTLADLQRDISGRQVIDVELLNVSGDITGSLGGIAGVEEVRETYLDGNAGRSFRLTVRGDIDPRADIFKKAVDSDWIIVAMAREKRSLEDIFHQLTKTD
ncbi:MAG: ATP-binding cassette domain-containing protein [Calditrichaeota bacterium]|nr:ATP-binding cassette domain-containing protein [Calditrichota bacterium]